MKETITRVLDRHDRIAIAGGPRTGKTSASELVNDRFVLHTDDFIHLSWSDQPQAIIDDLNDRDRFLVEGVQVGRALRKGLKVDCVVILTSPFVCLSPGQERMTKGCHKILGDYLRLPSSSEVEIIKF